jgi:hypothetical protein
MKGISELNIRSKMEQIMTLEIANEQELLNIKYKYENLEPSKQSEIIIEKQPKQIKKYENLAPSITTPIEIKHKFNVLKGIIVKRLFIERTTSIFDVFKTKKNDSKMTLTEGRHIEFLMQNNCQRNNNRYTTWKRKENPKPKSVMYIDMPYVTSGKNTIILREKRELTCKSALIRQKKLDYLKDLMRRLEKQKKKASNELNKYNPRLFNKIKATIEQRKKEAEYLKKITNKELNKAKDMNYRLKEKINDKMNRKIDRIEMNYKIKMQDIYDWQERLRQKQEKLDTKFNQANYLYREANKIVKLNKKEIEEGTNENKTPYELKMDRLQKASVKDWQKAHLKLDTQEKELENMHNIINQDEEEDEEEEDYNTPEFIENDD